MFNDAGSLAVPTPMGNSFRSHRKSTMPLGDGFGSRRDNANATDNRSFTGHVLGQQSPVSIPFPLQPCDSRTIILASDSRSLLSI